MEIIFQISYDVDDLVYVINLRMRSLLDIVMYGLSYYYAKLSLLFRLS